MQALSPSVRRGPRQRGPEPQLPAAEARFPFVTAEARGLSEDLTCVVEEVELRPVVLLVDDVDASAVRPPGLPRSARSSPVRGVPCSRPFPSLKLQSGLHAVLGPNKSPNRTIAMALCTGKALAKLPALL